MESETVTREYRRLRAKGWHAKEAARAARVILDWESAGGFLYDGDERDKSEAPGESVYCPGPIRLRIEWDEFCSMEDLKGDCFNRAANPDIQESRMAREEREFEERVARDGVVGIIGEFWDGAEWQHADSCFGFVGDDWKDSGYDSDIMDSTLDAWRSHLESEARDLESTRPDMYATAN